MSADGQAVGANHGVVLYRCRDLILGVDQRRRKADTHTLPACLHSTGTNGVFGLVADRHSNIAGMNMPAEKRIRASPIDKHGNRTGQAHRAGVAADSARNGLYRQQTAIFAILILGQRRVNHNVAGIGGFRAVLHAVGCDRAIHFSRSRVGIAGNTYARGDVVGVQVGCRGDGRARSIGAEVGAVFCFYIKAESGEIPENSGIRFVLCDVYSRSRRDVHLLRVLILSGPCSRAHTGLRKSAGCRRPACARIGRGGDGDGNGEKQL